jgi:hypothetical protein
MKAIRSHVYSGVMATGLASLLLAGLLAFSANSVRAGSCGDCTDDCSAPPCGVKANEGACYAEGSNECEDGCACTKNINICECST